MVYVLRIELNIDLLIDETVSFFFILKKINIRTEIHFQLDVLLNIGV